MSDENVWDVLEEMVRDSTLIANNYSLSNLQVKEFRDRIEAAYMREVTELKEWVDNYRYEASLQE